MTGRVQVSGIPAPRTWARAELLLTGTLLALAAVAWLLTNSLAMPDMRMGILTRMQPMDPDRGAAPTAFALFLLTWVVMMAAMMLPAITPFTVGVNRLMRAQPAGGGSVAALTVGYLLVWSTAGGLAYLVLRGFEAFAADGRTVESTVEGSMATTRAGALVLLAAGVYQFTPLKRWCLVRCRSPLALVMRYGELAARSRRGSLLVGINHGGYCLGCCWALMAVLLAVGVMNLAWMAGIAAMIAVEKILPHGQMLSYLLGAVLTGLGTVLLAAPGLVTTLT